MMESINRLNVNGEEYKFLGGFAETGGECFVLNLDKTDLDILEELYKNGLSIKNVEIYYDDKLIYQSQLTFGMNRYHQCEADFFEID